MESGHGQILGLVVLREELPKICPWAGAVKRKEPCPGRLEAGARASI
ncbi:hypothetical protein D516_1613 [Rhodobacter sp. AKP1]|nr:Hypothetical Protein RSKD131_3715 [Cereibacter sphaeroides KD131]EKX57363.1 hypothetical protein D516_1613 [Rhodobacter sp. AKP1]